MFEIQNTPHRRFNPLTGEWVLVSPHRMQRPWQGQVEELNAEILPEYDPQCYLCPGNDRAGGMKNPDYENTFVFTNDFAALLPDAPGQHVDAHPLLKTAAQPGTCRVLCFSPRHDLTLARMSLPDVRRVIDLWSDQTTELGETYRWVQVFENRGAMMGSSNPHPHGQIWATQDLPLEAEKEDHRQRAYFEKNGRPLLLDYADLEIKQQVRLVAHNKHWVIVVPFWAVWPFETLVLPRKAVRRLPDLTAEERDALAEILQQLLQRYDGLFNTSFHYSMGWHGAPYGQGDQQHWQLHAHFYPPLLRSATVRKFMVGYEMLGEPQRDLTAEQAAARLRD